MEYKNILPTERTDSYGNIRDYENLPPSKSMDLYGFIRGGVCDKVHHARVIREVGAKIFLSELEEQGCIETENGKCSIVDFPKITNEDIIRHFGGKNFDCNVEIGYRRFMEDVVKRRYERKCKFRRESLNRWLEIISSLEYRDFGYCPPHKGPLYDKRKERGDFKDVKSTI